MNFLAFDIEAANGYKLYSICSIGVVIADENFNIISSQNIWINPKTKYNLNGTRKNVGIDLHLDKKLLDSSPDFSQVYPKIKQLLTDPNNLVIGHAVDADVRMLNAACKHYNLPSINFDFICSQLLYKLYKGEKEVKALGKIATDLGVTFNQHNSEADANMSLMTLKYLVEQSGLSVNQLLEKYHIRIGNNKNFELTRPVSLDGQLSKKHQTQVAVEKIKDFAKSIKRTSTNYKDKVFCIARSLELSNSPLLYKVVQELVQGGARYSSKLVKCNVYVKNVITTEQDVMREKRVNELVEQGQVTVMEINQIVKVGTIMKVQQFLQKHNQSTHDIDTSVLLEKCIDEMTLGLSGEGSIPMIPTYLQNVSRDKITSGKRLLIDAGGTNFRSAVGSFEDGRVKIENLQKTIMPASNEYLTKQQFYSRIAQNVEYLQGDYDDVGFCFSYQVDMQPNMDGKVVMFSKEIKAPEVIDTFVGEETLKAISAHSNKPRKIVILNDTVATLLGGMALSEKKYSAYTGYIFGTGTNLCYIEDTQNIKKVANLPDGQMLVNTEMGSCNVFTQGDFDKIVSNATAAPTKQLFEKMSSGKYLADIISQAFIFAEKEGLFQDNLKMYNFELKDVSAFLNGAKDGVYDVFGCDADVEIAKEICLDLIDRSAKMGAIMNSAAIIMSCKDKALPVGIVAEGTTFNKLPTFRVNFEKYLKQILGEKGISFEILQGEELNLVGTLMATMAL